MAVNRYPGSCAYCDGYVPKRGGVLVGSRPRKPAHLACAREEEAEVVTMVFSSGAVATVNRHGRCEDAPCCGCCT